MSDRDRTLVTVEIAGEQYTIRADATPEYTRRCAEYVDEMIAEILQAGSLVQVQKAAILAALAVADQLFQTRDELASLRERGAQHASKLTEDIESKLTANELASGR